MDTITKGTIFSPKKTLNFGGNAVFIDTPIVMGILNATPDSFFDGGKYTSVDLALQQAMKMIEDGASIIDIGGYSSRPGADNISEKEEKERVLPIIEAIRKESPNSIISIDTFRSGVAMTAIEKGASMVNDISGGTLDTDMFDVVARMEVPYILMHMRGTPQSMNQKTDYQNLIGDIIDELLVSLEKAKEAGIQDIIIDPGVGFSKTVDQNFQIVKNLDYFHTLGRPVLAGLSRKSFIYNTLETSSESALNGTTAMNMVALLSGADILRVHDVKEANECIKLYNSLN